jgi:hypothetical protein
MANKTEWRIGEEGANEVCRKNARLMEMIFDSLVTPCGNPYCNWKVSSIRSRNFTVPEYGDVCATCHDLYTNLTMMNLRLTDTMYFQKIHAGWIAEEKKKLRDRDRNDKLGL